MWAGLPGFKSDRSGGWEELQLAPRGYVPLARAGALQEGALKIAARDVRLPKSNFSGRVNQRLEKVGARRHLR